MRRSIQTLAAFFCFFGSKLPRHAAGRMAGVLLASILLAPAIYAQEEIPPKVVVPTDSSAIELTTEAVQARMKQTEEAKDLDDALRKKVLETYTEVLGQIKIAGDWGAMASEFEKVRKDAPDLLQKIKGDLAQPPVEPKPQVPEGASLGQLEQLLAQAEADLAAAQKENADLAVEYDRRGNRRLEIPKLTTAAKQRLDEIEKQTVAPPTTPEPPQLSAAKRILVQARKKAAEQEINAYNEEMLSYDARVDSLTARRDRAARNVSQSEKLAKSWREIVNESRRKEAERGAKEARDASVAAKRVHSEVLKLARENAALANQRTGPEGFAAKIEKVAQELEGLNKTLTKVREDLKGVKEKVKAAGLMEAMSALLRKHREALPNPRKYQRNIGARNAEISKVQLQMLDYGDQRAALAEIEDELDEIFARLDPNLSTSERRQIEESARELLQTRRDILESLIKDSDSYFTKLIDLNTAERQLIVEVEGYIQYVDEQILWFRSTTPLGRDELLKSYPAFRWLASRKAWQEVFGSLGEDFRSAPALYIVTFLIFIALLALRRRFRLRLQAVASLLPKSQTDKFTYTIRASYLTLLIAVPFPAVVAFLGWRLGGVETSDFAKCVGYGLYETSRFFLAMEIFRKICLPMGLGEEHFRWRSATLKVVRRNLLWLMGVALPMLFVISTLDAHENEAWIGSLGRAAFIAAMVSLSVFAHKVLRPDGEVMRDFVRRTRGAWVARLRYSWYALGVGMPIGLAVGSAAGYHYTAMQLERRLVETIVLALGVLLGNELVLRWLFVIRRRLALRKAQRRRDLPKGREAEKRALGPAAQEIKLHDMSVQAQKAIQTVVALVVIIGIWLIWVDVLPALGILQRIDLWTMKGEVTKEIKRPDGTTSLETAEELVPITAGHVALAGLIVVLTIIAVRNLPGLLEMTVLQRMPMDAGVQYAIAAILKYLITVVGIVAAFAEVGVGWAKVQWLIAAMTVGLGFGLQEIFGNFVSGLIILFERPVRVGDVVTVGDITGTVTNIRIRATTILDWDRKELIVPNKEFVTGRLVNWTLSDSILRLVIPVGIAYGSDTDLAKKVLLDVATSNPVVLSDPAPTVVFMGFGDSTYNFELRIFVPDVNTYMMARHEINNAIKKAFEEAKIEIAFPQRDIHIRSVEQPFPLIDHREKK